jgi:uncharacterized membrane protein
MNQRVIGIALIVVAIVIAAGTYIANHRAEQTIQVVVNETGTCFLNDGTCLHSETNTFTIIGYVIAGLLFLVGLYVSIFDKTKEKLEKHSQEVEKAVSEVHKVKEDIAKKTEKDEFEVFLSAFNRHEQLILKSVKEQDGILQSTLRYRVGMSKAALSMKLKEFEEKGLISRKIEGKTNKIFLRKRF